MRLGDNHRLQPNLDGWAGPPDGPEDTVVHVCGGCGREYAPGGFAVAHGFEPCPGRFA